MAFWEDRNLAWAWAWAKYGVVDVFDEWLMLILVRWCVWHVLAGHGDVTV